MRIALVHPTYWPEVERGAERIVHDAAVALARRGHDVTILTSHLGRSSVALEEGVTVVRDRRPRGTGRLEARAGIELFTATIPQTAWRLARGGFDVAHTFAVVSGYAAARAQAARGPRFVLSLMGIPSPRSVRLRWLRWSLLRHALDRAAAATVLSEAAAAGFRHALGRDAAVLPAGVFCADFPAGAERSRVPTVFCAANLDDPRKRGPLLVRAFERLRRRRPDALLSLAWRSTSYQSRAPLPASEAVEAIEGLSTPDLARAYGAAWTSVLPAVDEALGLVMLESLAAGTPVVAARSGACPEIVSTSAVGRLFEPDDEDDLVRALDEGLALASLGETQRACRERALRYDWPTIVGSYEVLYRELTDADR